MFYWFYILLTTSFVFQQRKTPVLDHDTPRLCFRSLLYVSGPYASDYSVRRQGLLPPAGNERAVPSTQVKSGTEISPLDGDTEFAECLRYTMRGARLEIRSCSLGNPSIDTTPGTGFCINSCGRIPVPPVPRMAPVNGDSQNPSEAPVSATPADESSGVHVTNI